MCSQKTASGPPGSCWQCKFGSEPLNQKLQGRAHTLCLTWLPGDADECLHLRITSVQRVLFLKIQSIAPEKISNQPEVTHVHDNSLGKNNIYNRSSINFFFSILKLILDLMSNCSFLYLDTGLASFALPGWCLIWHVISTCGVVGSSWDLEQNM